VTTEEGCLRFVDANGVLTYQSILIHTYHGVLASGNLGVIATAYTDPNDPLQTPINVAALSGHQVTVGACPVPGSGTVGPDAETVKACYKVVGPTGAVTVAPIILVPSFVNPGDPIIWTAFYADGLTPVLPFDMANVVECPCCGDCAPSTPRGLITAWL
jgi:hypothetical protein